MTSKTVRLKTLLASSAAAALVLGAAGTAWGQDTDVSEDDDALDTIIVTSSKREQRITDVPFAVTAIGGEEIRARGALSIEDLQYSVPGLNIQGSSPGAAQVSLRGINPGFGTGLPVVGVYVDEVGITVDQQQRNGSFPLVDVERIEVLRGPQGTLYGQGSLAGTIRYITRNPDLQEVDGFVEMNLNTVKNGGLGSRVTGAIGIPLVEGKLGLRVTAGTEDVAGWIDYPDAGPNGIGDANSTERSFIRSKLFFTPTEKFTASVLYQYYDQQSDTDSIVSIATPRRRSLGQLLPATDEGHIVNGIFEYDFGDEVLVASTGYQNRTVNFGIAPIPTFIGTADNMFEVYSQELRLSSDDDSAFQYTIGAFYRDFESLAGFFGNLNTLTSESFAFFGEASYQVSEKVGLLVGARFFDDTRNITGPALPPLPTGDFSAFTPKFSVTLDWNEDITSYATVSNGFRSGGFNGTGTTFGAEDFWNYEVGTKAMFMDGKLFVDAVVYYADYAERQGQIPQEVQPGVFIAETTTGGAASGFGAEIAVNAKLGAGVQLDANMGWNDLTYDVTTVEAPAGERLSGATPFTASVALSQTVDLTSDIEGFWRIDYQYADPTIYNQRVPIPGLQPGQPGFLFNSLTAGAQNIINLSFGIQTGPIIITLEGRNLANEGDLLYPASPAEAVQLRPRSLGATVRFDF